MTTIFHRISTEERYTVNNDSKRATDLGLAMIKTAMEAARTDGAKVNVIFFDRDPAGDWEMIAADYKGEKVLCRMKLTARWFAPAARPSAVAAIDTAADGGHGSMGMLRR